MEISAGQVIGRAELTIVTRKIEIESLVTKTRSSSSPARAPKALIRSLPTLSPSPLGLHDLCRGVPALSIRPPRRAGFGQAEGRGIGEMTLITTAHARASYGSVSSLFSSARDA